MTPAFISTSVIGFALIITNVVLAFNTYTNSTEFATWAVYVCACFIPMFGATWGYILSWLVSAIFRKIKPEWVTRFGHQQFRTVALETGAQNLKLVTSIMILAFMDCPGVLATTLLFPILYAIGV